MFEQGSGLTTDTLKKNKSDSSTEGAVESDKLKTGDLVRRPLPHSGLEVMKP